MKQYLMYSLSVILNYDGVNTKKIITKAKHRTYPTGKDFLSAENIQAEI